MTTTSAGVFVDLPVHAGDQVFGDAPLVRVAVLDRIVAGVEAAPR